MIGKFIAGAGNLLDLPGSMVRDALAGQNPIDQLATPFSDTNRTTGRGLLRSYGLAGDKDTWGNYLGGMAAETLLDPTNLIPGGLLAKYAMKLRGVKSANAGIDAANALSKQQRAMGWMPEEIARQTKIVDPASGSPKRMYHGTPYVYDQYDFNKLDEDALYGKGVYTTDDPAVASSYVNKGSPTNEQILEYYKPGNVVKSYGGMDEVVDVAVTPEGLFDNVTVKPLDGRGLPLRRHATWPDIKDAGNANVRMQYIDSRKPFNMNEPLDDASPAIAAILEKAIPSASDPSWSGWGSLRADLMDSVGPSASGDAAWRAIKSQGIDPSEALRAIGYDSIQHKGGTSPRGWVDHNVTIALDPSQIYKPYIAKGLRDRLPQPKRPRVGRGLVGYHALARGGHQQ